MGFSFYTLFDFEKIFNARYFTYSNTHIQAYIYTSALGTYMYVVSSSRVCIIVHLVHQAVQELHCLDSYS